MEDNILGMTPISDSETVSPRGMVEHLLNGIGVGDYSDPVRNGDLLFSTVCLIQEVRKLTEVASAGAGYSKIRPLWC